MPAFESISLREALEFKDCISFAIITATKIEIDEVRNQLRPLPGKSKLLRTFKNNQTYYLGVFGAYGVVVAKSGMGAMAPDGAINTTRDAIQDWTPNAVVMLGIALELITASKRLAIF